MTINLGYEFVKSILSGGILVENEDEGEKAFVSFTYIPQKERVNVDAVANDNAVVTLDLSRDDAETIVAYLQETILSKENN